MMLANNARAPFFFLRCMNAWNGHFSTADQGLDSRTGSAGLVPVVLPLFLGRRTPSEDARQIKRWQACASERGRWRNQLRQDTKGGLRIIDAGVGIGGTLVPGARFLDLPSDTPDSASLGL